VITPKTENFISLHNINNKEKEIVLFKSRMEELYKLEETAKMALIK
jgi:hypothetical protein